MSTLLTQNGTLPLVKFQGWTCLLHDTRFVIRMFELDVSTSMSLDHYNAAIAYDETD